MSKLNASPLWIKKLILIPIFLIMILTVNAQEKKETAEKPQDKPVEKPVELKLSGFIMNNMFYDTRKNVDALDGMVLLFPLPADRDSAGNDLNGVKSLSLLSFATRLKFNITGPDAFGAKTSGFIEFDFTARANAATVRFRQAWAKLTWTNTELLVGRAWHPMVSTDVVPSVMALSWGAPFQPFNRSDQVTLTQKVDKINVIISAILQNDYMNNGPSGKSCLYQNNAIVPNFDAQIKYKSDKAIFGLGGDFKRLRPRIYTVTKTGKKLETNAGINSDALFAYGQIKTGKLVINAKSILATNTSESLMAGAYGISSYDSITGHEEYTAYKHWFLWGNISYGEKLKISLFGGYLKNLGAGKNLVSPATKTSPPTVFGLGETIGEMIRVTPTVSYTSGKMTLAFEFENNIASYGTIDYADKGKIKHASNITGRRLLCTMYYYF